MPSAAPAIVRERISKPYCEVPFFGCTRFTAKLYRVDILMTGKRPNLPELLRWLKYA